MLSCVCNLSFLFPFHKTDSNFDNEEEPEREVEEAEEDIVVEGAPVVTSESTIATANNVERAGALGQSRGEAPPPPPTTLQRQTTSGFRSMIQCPEKLMDAFNSLAIKAERKGNIFTLL